MGITSLGDEDWMSATADDQNSDGFVDPRARVCPQCGAPSSTTAFCESCGLNLSGIERLPTHEEWKDDEARNSPATLALAERVERIGPLSISLFDFPESERTEASPQVTTAVERTLKDALRRAVPADQRDEDGGVGIDLEMSAGVAAARVRLSSGSTIGQILI
jgi:hypothetical protein